MRFEYKFVPVGSGSDEELQKLNALGKEGWEIVAAAFGLVILKRVIK